MNVVVVPLLPKLKGADMSLLDHRSKFWRAYPEYVAAYKEMRRVGTAHATGDSLRAMYASLIVMQAGMGEKFAPQVFAWLRRYGSDGAIACESHSLLRNEAATWDVAMHGPMAGAVYSIVESVS